MVASASSFFVRRAVLISSVVSSVTSTEMSDGMTPVKMLRHISCVQYFLATNLVIMKLET